MLIIILVSVVILLAFIILILSLVLFGQRKDLSELVEEIEAQRVNNTTARRDLQEHYEDLLMNAADNIEDLSQRVINAHTSLQLMLQEHAKLDPVLSFEPIPESTDKVEESEGVTT